MIPVNKICDFFEIIVVVKQWLCYLKIKDYKQNNQVAFLTENFENQRISFWIKNQSRILSSELPYNDIIFFSCMSGISHENTVD